MKFRYLFVIIALFIVIYLKAQNPYHLMLDTLYSHTVPTITVEQLLKEKDSVLLLDTRSREEYDISHISKAVFADFDSFAPSDLRLNSKTQKIVVYCTVGYRSEKIGEQLKKAGYSNVHNLYGGIFEWANKTEPLFDSSLMQTQKVHTYNRNWSIWLEKGEKIYHD